MEKVGENRGILKFNSTINSGECFRFRHCHHHEHDIPRHLHCLHNGSVRGTQCLYSNSTREPPFLLCCRIGGSWSFQTDQHCPSSLVPIPPRLASTLWLFIYTYIFTAHVYFWPLLTILNFHENICPAVAHHSFAFSPSHIKKNHTLQKNQHCFSYTVYIVEISLKILALGPIQYFKKFWNMWVSLCTDNCSVYCVMWQSRDQWYCRCDFVVITVSLIAVCLELHPLYHSLAVVRPIKLIRSVQFVTCLKQVSILSLPPSLPPFSLSRSLALRIIRVKKRYRDIMNTMVVLTPRLIRWPVTW